MSTVRTLEVDNVAERRKEERTGLGGRGWGSRWGAWWVWSKQEDQSIFIDL